MKNLNKSLITRKKYNEIKKYDRQQMDIFLNDIYLTAYEDGYKEAFTCLYQKFISEEFKTVLKSIKGFGSTKTEKIINIISEQMKGEI